MKRVIYLICADAELRQEFARELAAADVADQVWQAGRMSQVRDVLRRLAPTAILLDQSALEAEAPRDSVEAAVAALTEFAPVVVVASPQHQGVLAFLITSGAVDFVARAGEFLPVAVGLLERRVRLAEQAAMAAALPSLAPADLNEDFGETLRHEVNNPLTGILGNAELLLARREYLPAVAVQRLQTIADLAVRLRETVRRLSNAWETRHDHARSA
jgi:signal transduction histidine kinase